MEPLPDTGDALRGKLEVDFQGARGILFLFAGTRLRFGRNSNRAAVENDLVLRAFPRSPTEDPKLVEARTRDVSGHHGAFVLTRDGVAVRDDGSKLGTELDGVRLRPHELVPLPEHFVLEAAKVLALRGRVLLMGARPDSSSEGVAGTQAHPVQAVRLERVRDGEHMSYVLIVRDATIGSDDHDSVFLPHPNVKPGHARLTVRQGKFAIGHGRPDARVSVGGRELAPAEVADLEPGCDVLLDGTRLRFGVARDEDMKV